MSRSGAGVDFTRLYAELGVAPEAGLDAFRRAYRRRVAELHPDRPARAPRDPALLVMLNRGYESVLAFHRGHGRIPGQSVASGRERARTRAPSAPGTVVARGEAVPRRTPRIRVLLLPVLLVIAAIWHWLPEGPAPTATAGLAPAAQLRASAAGPARIQLGMDRATVARLLGEPVARDDADARWIYGPSWLRFECGRLADWYGSRLRPLGHAPHRPTAAERTRHPPGPACPEALHPLGKRTHGED